MPKIFALSFLSDFELFQWFTTKQQFTTIIGGIFIPYLKKNLCMKENLLTALTTEKGVRIPITKTIYEPVLNELKKMGIEMVEEWGLAEEN